ncbi:hypothetical protein BJX66DRAFT_298351 [Aspergillus keveii]|uniref:Uncharacterized protein n=1 Tax=Aspergillus keveii TaxID=714993 RepID=A0ABR4GDP6_9EURO
MRIFSFLILANSLWILPVFTERITYGTDCYIDGNTFHINQPSDIAELSADCETVHGDIIVSQNYTGPFILPNITHIYGKIEIVPAAKGSSGRDYDPSLAPKIPVLEAPDLLWIQKLQIVYVGELARVSMPKLVEAESIQWFHIANTTSEFDLRSLGSVDYLRLEAEWTSINLDSLRSVDTLRIYGPGSYWTDSGLSLELSLPQLGSATELRIQARVSRVSMPKLTRIKSHLIVSCDPIVSSCPAGPDFGLEFPVLNYLGGELSVGGALTSLSIPSLNDSRSTIEIGSSSPTGLNVSLPLANATVINLSGYVYDLKLPNLTAAGDINLSPYVRGIDLPNLKDLKSLTIDPINESFDCSAFLNKWWGLIDSNGRPLRVRCGPARDGHTRKKPNSGPGVFVRIVLPTFIGVVVLSGIIAVVLYTWRHGVLSLRLLKARVKAAWKDDGSEYDSEGEGLLMGYHIEVSDDEDGNRTTDDEGIGRAVKRRRLLSAGRRGIPMHPLVRTGLIIEWSYSVIDGGV